MYDFDVTSLRAGGAAANDPAPLVSLLRFRQTAGPGGFSSRARSYREFLNNTEAPLGAGTIPGPTEADHP